MSDYGTISYPDNDGNGMTDREARAIIAALIAALPDHRLPELRIETEESTGQRTAWSGGRGLCLHSAKRNGVLDPSVHVDSAIRDLLQAEAVRRLEVSEGPVTP